MSTLISSSARKVYGVQRVCRVLLQSRTTFYRIAQGSSMQGKRGPKTTLNDVQLLSKIRTDIFNSPWKGEGHRKIHARLNRQLPTRVGRDRVRRLMRENKLLSPHRVFPRSRKQHKGRICTHCPNILWGTDGTKIWTQKDGWVWLFATIDHWNSECVGHHIVKKGDRFAAMESIRKGVLQCYGGLRKGIAKGLQLRMDHGSQYRSDYTQKELEYLGIQASMAYVKEPETNGVVERFNRTLKEQVVDGVYYRNVQEVRESIDRFVKKYNEAWILSKIGYMSPVEARKKELCFPPNRQENAVPLVETRASKASIVYPCCNGRAA